MNKFVIIIGLVLLLSACSSDNSVTGEEPGGNEPTVARTIELSPEASQAAAAVQGFNVDFFRNVAISDEYKGKNVACSPLSATMLLSLLSNAASNQAATEIASVLGYSDTDALNNLYTTLSSELPALDPKATLAFANSVWYDKQYTLTDAFSSVANNCYKADIFKRDLSGETPSVKNDINSWVSDKTKGLIKNITVKMPVLSALINATYFRARWTYPFDKKYTSKATFKGVNGDSEINMMVKTETYLYDETEDYKIIEVPFGAGAFAAVFILPTNGPEDFLKSKALKNILNQELHKSYRSLFLPRFKIAEDEEINLTRILYNMGIKNIFDPHNLKIFNESPLVEDINVFQKTSVEFKEEGAEAAGVTWLVPEGSDGTPIPAITFDRPFIFLITEKSTKTILFAGKIMSL